MIADRVELIISIHAPLAGSDLPPGRHTSCPGNFNPRSPCGERRPARNRTWTTSYFNPRSPCGERHYWVTHYVNGLPISIHAPLAGSDHARPVDAPFQPVFQSTLPLRGATVVAAELGTCYQFQSTLPLRGATLRIRHIRIHNGISIHAPLAGSDHFRTGQVFSGYYFNPRSPCGERHRLITGMETCLEFQSTLPLRGATIYIRRNLWS